MSDIKAIKMITGEEVLAEVVSANEVTVRFKNPLMIVMQKGPNGAQLGFIPFMPYVKGDYELSVKNVVFLVEVDDELRNQYNTIFGTGIVVPPKQLITG